MNNTKKILLSTCALSGLIIGLGGCSTIEEDTATVGKCYQINACKGLGACGGVANTCAGKNSCRGKGWLKTSKKRCLNKGGQFES